jgi:hypothetical protein
VVTKTILTETDGFTPLIDSIVDAFGITGAAIFGMVWRYCQMKDGVCKANQETIADRLCLKRETVNRYLAKFVTAGFLQDLTPLLRNRPHIYRDTGKASLRVAILAGVTDGVTDGVIGGVIGGVIKSHTEERKKEKIQKKEEEEEKPSAPPSLSIAEEALWEVKKAFGEVDPKRFEEVLKDALVFREKKGAIAFILEMYPAGELEARRKRDKKLLASPVPACEESEFAKRIRLGDYVKPSELKHGVTQAVKQPA